MGGFNHLLKLPVSRDRCFEFGRNGGDGFEEAYGDRGVAYCLKREFDGQGREQERYDYLSRKLIQTIRRVSEAQAVVAGIALKYPA